ncbi:trypsin-domain-containing protein [Periconia macrospinosa]|uniref:Trypsin-domain-containing protein n=1 Tax=Periconia macrospinosa TaxID=97972 RepID=A0A2V1E5P0_9PLEO|nr:trypsin-domain-containing protein [Periconia macrospinosa]
MKSIAILALPWLALSAPASIPFDEDISSIQIVGGVNAAVGDFPFIVALSLGGLFQCGGSLLDETTVLSAAHCVTGESLEGMFIRTGSLNRDEGLFSNISAYTIHPQYDRDTSQNDVAILKLATPIAESSTIKYAKLAPANNDPAPGSILTVGGWGVSNTATSHRPTLLQKVDVPVVSREECRTKYQSYLVSEQMFCAGYAEGGKDSCQSDSGGPIVDADKTVIGVVSWGFGCALPNYPGVYARVGALLDFINSV